MPSLLDCARTIDERVSDVYARYNKGELTNRTAVDEFTRLRTANNWVWAGMPCHIPGCGCNGVEREAATP